MAAITVSNVSKAFGATPVLKGVDLSVEDGSFFTLLGPSGCGKTTLLRTIAGFIEPQSGRLLFDREDVTHTPVHKRDIGMVFQDYALFPDKTVFNNVAYGLRARRIDERTIGIRVAEYLERVGLGPLGSRYPAELSGGQRQRAALARALVINPRVLLMDEPLSNLDAKLRVAMRETILDLQRAARITTMFVTHDQEEALSISDRIAIMDRGAIAQVGVPEDLYERPASAYVAEFIGVANLLPVKVERRADDRHIVVSMAGREFRCADGGVSLGTAAKLIVRPEHVLLSNAEDAPSAQNTIEGRVARRRYLGPKTVYTIAFRGGLTITAERHAGTYGPALDEGQAVAVAIPTTVRAVAG